MKIYTNVDNTYELYIYIQVFDLITRNYFKCYLTREFLRENQFISPIKKYFTFISLEIEGIFYVYKSMTIFSVSSHTSPFLTLMLYLFNPYPTKVENVMSS